VRARAQQEDYSLVGFLPLNIYDTVSIYPPTHPSISKISKSQISGLRANLFTNKRIANACKSLITKEKNRQYVMVVVGIWGGEFVLLRLY
jgi:hypothetical protein